MMDRHTLFVKNLEARLDRAGGLAKKAGTDKFDYLSEDCIRYDYFSAILEAENRKTEDLFLEYPHPNDRYIKEGKTRQNGQKKEIDCVVLDNGKPGRIIEAIELKYVSESKNGTLNTTDRICLLFADFYRLLDADLSPGQDNRESDNPDNMGIERTVVLVSCKTMNYYINNKHNGFDFLFSGKLDKNWQDCDKETVFGNSGETGPKRKQIESGTYPGYEPRPFSIQRIWLQEIEKANYLIAVFRVKEAKQPHERA